MGVRLFCWVMFYLLGTGDAGVSQSPMYRVIKRGQDVDLVCDPVSGHSGLYWYRQNPGQGPVFMVYFQNTFLFDKSGMPSDRFSAVRPKGSFSILNIQSTDQEDSGIYLCASSLVTAWYRCFLPPHKPLTSFSSQCVEPLCRIKHYLSFIQSHHWNIHKSLAVNMSERNN
uniref:Ig-like domain-containing protein n=1 Tax=Peromyscus maniculatus bairdii TaxID=230844 RepID=A0A8C8UD31_PERMB